LTGLNLAKIIMKIQLKYTTMINSFKASAHRVKNPTVLTNLERTRIEYLDIKNPI
tara:strand:+ start:544 stop:708 length:165 start_codon:yes stop_codon:yes gene_type:complete